MNAHKWAFAGLLVVVVGCGGGGGGGSGGPQNSSPELRAGPLMFSNVVFPPRSSVNLFADFNEDGRGDLLMVPRERGSGTDTRGIYLRLGSAGNLFDDLQAVDDNLSGRGQPIVGDFDNDGHLDVAIGRSSLLLLPGNGDGTFDAEATIDALTGDPAPRSLMTADVDGDGDDDLLAMIFDSAPATPLIAAYLNNGGGAFTRVDTAVINGINLTGAPVDFDHDGNLDVVVVAGASPTFTFGIYFGNGAGAFGNPVVLSSTNIIFCAATGDTNGDGDPDVVAVSPPDFDQFFELHTFLGAGNGTFTALAPQTTSAGGLPELSIAQLAEASGDGMPDLVVSLTGFIGGHWAFEGNGDGTFNPETLLARTDTATAIVHDFTGDGLPDIYAGVLVPGSPGGGFGALSRLNVGEGSAALGSVDIDASGEDDLLTYSRELRTYLSNGDETFTLTDTDPFPTETPYTGTMYTADFNNDTLPDVAALFTHEVYPTIGVLLNQNDGTLEQASAIDLYINTFHLDVLCEPADLDGDGNLDLFGNTFASDIGMVVYTGWVWVAFGNGDGTFQPITKPFNDRTSVVASADFDGDGVRSLVVHDSAAGLVRIFHTQSNQTFTTGPVLTGNTDEIREALTVGRLDGDALDDLVVFETGDDIALYYGNTSNGVDTGQTFNLPTSESARAVRIVASGSGPRIVATRQYSRADPYRTLLSVFEETGSRSFAFNSDALCNGAFVSDAPTHIVDLNVDGYLDLITPWDDMVEIVRGNAGGGFDPPFYFDITTEDTYDRMAIGDWDGDGDIDLAAPDDVDVVIANNQFFD